MILNPITLNVIASILLGIGLCAVPQLKRNPSTWLGTFGAAMFLMLGLGFVQSQDSLDYLQASEKILFFGSLILGPALFLGFGMPKQKLWLRLLLGGLCLTANITTTIIVSTELAKTEDGRKLTPELQEKVKTLTYEILRQNFKASVDNTSGKPIRKTGPYKDLKTKENPIGSITEKFAEKLVSQKAIGPFYKVSIMGKPEIQEIFSARRQSETEIFNAIIVKGIVEFTIEVTPMEKTQQGFKASQPKTFSLNIKFRMTGKIEKGFEIQELHLN